MRSAIFWTGVTDSYVILRYQWYLVTWQLNQAIDWFECGVTLLDSVVRLRITQHTSITLQLRHNGRDSVSDRQLHDCLLNRLFRRRSKKTPKLTGLCAGKSPGNGEFPAQMSSNAENVSIWWHHQCGLRYVGASIWNNILSVNINPNVSEFIFSRSLKAAICNNLF